MKKSGSVSYDTEPCMTSSMARPTSMLAGKNATHLGWGDSQPARMGATTSAAPPTIMARQESSGLSSTAKASTNPALVTKESPSVAKNRRLAGYVFTLCNIYPMTSSEHVTQAPRVWISHAGCVKCIIATRMPLVTPNPPSCRRTSTPPKVARRARARSALARQPGRASGPVRPSELRR